MEAGTLIVRNTDTTLSAAEDVQIQNSPLSSFVSQAVGYLLQLLSKRILAQKSQTSHILFVKIGSQTFEHASNQIWCTVKVGSQYLNHLELHMEEFFQACHPHFTAVIKDMQDHFGGEHLWCEYPNNTAHETSTCKRTQWKIGPPGSLPQCHIVERQKLINTCSVCFRMLQETHHVLEECRHIENFLHKAGIINPQVKLKFSFDVNGKSVTYEFGPHSPRLCIGQKKILCDIRHFIRLPTSSPSSNGKIFPRCGVSYNMQQLNVSNVRERVQLKVHAVAALIPPRPITTTLLNQTVKKLQVLFYGPGDMPMCTSNKAQLGLCPTTLVKLEEYGLKIGQRLTQEEFVTGQRYVHCDWSFKLDVMDVAISDEDKEDENRGDDTTLLVIVFINATDKNKYSSLDNIQLLDYIQNNFAQIICKNKVKVRKAVATALNKILHNFSAHDQRQKLLDTSIPLITSAMSSIVTHSTNVNFRSDVFRLLEVSETREYRKELKRSLWKIANETYIVVVPETANSSEKSQKSEESIPATNIQKEIISTCTLRNIEHQSLDICQRKTVAVSLQPQRQDTDFEDLGTDAAPINEQIVEDKTSEGFSGFAFSSLNTEHSLSHGKENTSPDRTSHTVRRSLSKEFESHVNLEPSSAPGGPSDSSAEVLIQDIEEINNLDHFEFLGEDKVSLSEDARSNIGNHGTYMSPEQTSIGLHTSTELDTEKSSVQLPTEDWWDSVSWT